MCQQVNQHTHESYRDQYHGTIGNLDEDHIYEEIKV